jgi:uncharacterized membrane protein YdjX (TVP38/TMEM64 family)
MNHELRKRGTSPDPARRTSRVLLRLLPFGLLLALLIVAYGMGWHRDLSFEMLVRHSAAIDAFIADNRIVAVLVFVATYTAGAMLAMPAGVVLAVIGGFLFGAFTGGAASMIGSTIGATAVFAVARSAFGAHLLRRVGPRAESFAAGFRADAFCYVMFLRLVPVPSWFTNLTAALFAVRLPTFVAATALGRTPGSFILALLGAGLDSVLAPQAAAYRACLAAGGIDCRIDFDPANVLTPTLLAALVALGLLALLPVLARRLLWRRAAVGPERH